MSDNEKREPIRDARARVVAAAQFGELANEVIEDLKRTPSVEPADDVGGYYPNLWEEFKEQVQGRDSDVAEMYAGVARVKCEKVVDKLGIELKGLLWYSCEGFADWTGPADVVPLGDEVDQAIVNEVFNRVSMIADSEDIEYVFPESDSEEEETSFDDIECAEDEGAEAADDSSEGGPQTASLSADAAGSFPVVQRDGIEGQSSVNVSRKCVCLGEDAATALKSISNDADGEHLAGGPRSSTGLLRCRKCGQFFLHLSWEESHWDDRDEGMFDDYFPITADEAEVARLAGRRAEAAILVAGSEPRRYLFYSHTERVCVGWAFWPLGGTTRG